jgi:hypothetical protein
LKTSGAWWPDIVEINVNVGGERKELTIGAYMAVT